MVHRARLTDFGLISALDLAVREVKRLCRLVVAAFLLNMAVLRVVVSLVVDVDVRIVVVYHHYLATASQVLDVRLVVKMVRVGTSRIEGRVLLG